MAYILSADGSPYMNISLVKKGYKPVDFRTRYAFTFKTKIVIKIVLIPKGL